MTINFPALERSPRYREWNTYTVDQRIEVIYSWLFNGLTTRDIDFNILKLNPNKSKGYQSMGILHYIGLKRVHQGFFKDIPEFDALYLLQKLAIDSNYYLLYWYLWQHIKKNENASLFNDKTIKEIYPDENEILQKDWIINSLLIGKNSNRIIDQTLLNITDKNVIKFKQKNSTLIISNQSKKEAVKCLYDYRCQICGQYILRKGWSYSLSRKLEWTFLSADVHHILPLSEKGPDIRENMLCLCPNCHRKFHTGEFELKNGTKNIICKDELLGKNYSVIQKHPIIIF